MNKSRFFGLRIEPGEKILPEHKATIKLNKRQGFFFFTLNFNKDLMTDLTCSDEY